MSSYCYEAVDAGGLKIQGTLDVTDQSEALKRIKGMGLFPTKVAQPTPFQRKQGRALAAQTGVRISGGRIKPAVLAVFARQLATLVDVGMPLMRGLRILQEQTENQALKRVITDVIAAIEGGSSLSESLAAHPGVFSARFM
jgi:type IV pilus assembly protein PilC